MDSKNNPPKVIKYPTGDEATDHMIHLLEDLSHLVDRRCFDKDTERLVGARLLAEMFRDPKDQGDLHDTLELVKTLVLFLNTANSHKFFPY